MNTKKIIIRISVGIALCALYLLLLSPGFFWNNIKYTFQKPQAQSIEPAPASGQNIQPAAAQAPINKDPAVSPVPQQKPSNAFESNKLVISDLGIKSPIVYVDTANEALFQKGLENGVVHYPGSAMPGQAGNVYIFGHSSDFIFSPGHYKNVFSLLPRIKNGALIQITDASGHLFTYKVFQSKVIAKDDQSVLDQGNYLNKYLTLQTSYPIGTALKRFVVKAELVEVARNN